MAFIMRMVLVACIFASSASATITLSTTTRSGTSATGTGTAISGRAPLGVVIDAGSGTTTTHSTGSAEQIGIRFGEKKITTCSYTHATLTLTCTDAFTTFSWELNNAETDGDEAEWTASGADAGAYYHDGGTEVHGKPVGVRVNGLDVTEGTCGSLANGQWCWGDADTIGSNRVYVQDALGDPDGQSTGFVKVIYGDGEYIELQHADFNSGNPVYVYVNDKTSDDAITLMAAPTGASADETNVTVFQAVNPWTDLRYNYSVSCPNGTGGACIEDITNGDQRPGLTTTAIDETVGRGPIWAFVFKEGFGADAVITITANDDANGDTEDSQTIDVDETNWSACRDIYVDSSGTDITTCLSAAADNTKCTAGSPCQTFECGLEQARRESVCSRVLLSRGDTFTIVTSPTSWSSETLDVLVTGTGSGADPLVVGGAGITIFTTGGSNANIRFAGIDFQKTTGTQTMMTLNSDTSVIVGCDFDNDGTGSTLNRGIGTTTCDDAIVWDVDVDHSSTSSNYCIYDSSESGMARRAVVGLRCVNIGDEPNFRHYLSKSFFAYNYGSHSPLGDQANFRIAAGPHDADYNYVYANYFTGGQDCNWMIELFSDDVTTHDSILIDSNFLSQSGSNIDQVAGIEFEATGGGVKVVNNVFLGLDTGVQAVVGSAAQVPPAGLVANNSFYTTFAGGNQFVRSVTTASWGNIKVINNAIHMTATSASNRIITNEGNFDQLESTQILNNVASFTTGQVATTEGTSYNAPADWSAASMKAAQSNNETAPLFALPASMDFRLCTSSGVPDASCSGASPCIDAGYDLPTVYYDYSGAVRNSDDVGAWDDDSSGMSMGPTDGASDLLLMGVAR